jgi:hypothetical protein
MRIRVTCIAKGIRPIPGCSSRELLYLGPLVKTTPFTLCESPSLIGHLSSQPQGSASSLAQIAIKNLPSPEGILEGDGTRAGMLTPRPICYGFLTPWQTQADHGQLIRGLTTLYELSADDQPLQDYIRSFVAVQVSIRNGFGKPF